MAKPPETPPSSDIEGVNRDMRISLPQKDPHPDPGAALEQAENQTVARPKGDEAV